MHSELIVFEDNRSYQPYARHSGYDHPARLLAAFVAHLNRTGKICLKPWCWRRFCLLFKPGSEPPWLSSWWATSTREKKDLFLKQMEYLAYHTNRFDAAYQFLRGIAGDNWVFRNRRG
jgi:hypothetical protein